MNNRLRSFLTLLTFIVFVPGITFTLYSGQKSAGSISGRLTTGQKPLSGVPVQLVSAPSPANGLPKQVVAAVTDNNGYYRFDGVAAGTYDVVPVTTAHVITDLTHSYQPGKQVSIAAGENVINFDFDLPLAAKIQGQIKDAAGHPVAHEQVFLTAVTPNQKAAHIPVRNVITKPTDDQGNYTIDNVAPGRYVVSMGHPFGDSILEGPRSPKPPIYAQTFHPGTTDFARATVIDITYGEVIPAVDITVEEPLKTYRITGRVVDETTGTPIPNVAFSIRFRGNDGSNTGSSGSHLDLDKDSPGQFTIPTVLSGHLTITPLPNAASNTYGDPIEFDVTDKDVTGLEIKMHHGVMIKGQVVIEGPDGTSDKEKLAKFRFSAGLFGAKKGSTLPVQSGIDKDGYFQFAGVRSGPASFSLHALAPGMQNGFSIVRIEHNGQALSDGIDIGNENITGLRVIVQTAGNRGGVIRGEVKVEGEDFDGVLIVVHYLRTDGDQHFFLSAPLDARNRFVIENLVPGEYELSIGPMANGMTSDAASKTLGRMPTVKQKVTVTAGAESEVVLTMTLKPK